MEATRRVEVLIVGAGISGIGAAIQLRRQGFDDIVILVGANMMNPNRRRRVFETAVRAATDAVADALLALRDDSAPEPQVSFARADATG